MKNVLLIVHLPRATPRIEGLVRYLPEFEWQPIILTGVTSKYTDLPARIVETPYRDALGFLGRLLKIDPDKDAGQQIKNRLGVTSKKSPLDFFLTLGGAIINYPCPNKNWRPFALKAARELLQEGDIEVIMSSSAPVTSHLIAGELKTKHGIPWLADLRDLWSQNHNYGYGPIRKWFDRRLELKTLSTADALVTVSQPWADKLSTLHKGKVTYTINTGFEPETVNIPPANLTDKFTITYTGTIYSGKQDTSKLFAALRSLSSDGTINQNDIEVRFYGPAEGWLDKEIEQYGLVSVVKQYGAIPRHAAIEKQRESQLLLLLDWDDPQEKGVYPGKIFEYMAARRPILATGGMAGNVVDILLDETRAGRHAPTVEGIKGTLIEFYEEYKLTGKVAYNGLETEINKYTQREMARKFSEVLDQLA